MQHESWSKCAGGIQCAASERTGDKHTNSNRQSHRECAQLARSALVDSGGEHNQHQKKCGDSFEGHTAPTGIIAQQFRNKVGGVPPGFVGNDQLQQKRRHDRPGKLHAPVGKRFERSETARDPETDGDGGIEMAAGNVSERRDHNRKAEAVSESHREKADTAGRRIAQVKISADRAEGEENHGEGAKKLGGELLAEVVHRRSLRDRSECVVMLREKCSRKSQRCARKVESRVSKVWTVAPKCSSGWGQGKMKRASRLREARCKAVIV